MGEQEPCKPNQAKHARQITAPAGERLVMNLDLDLTKDDDENADILVEDEHNDLPEPKTFECETFQRQQVSHELPSASPTNIAIPHDEVER